MHSVAQTGRGKVRGVRRGGGSPPSGAEAVAAAAGGGAAPDGPPPTAVNPDAPDAGGTSFEMVAVDRVRESPSNPRRAFAGVEELAESVRAHGVLQPLIVRPLPAPADLSEMGGPAGEVAVAAGEPVPGWYELVAGARRLRAARLAGLGEVPAVVRRLDDRAVLEIQVVENDQRVDVSPVEQADGYAELIARPRVRRRVDRRQDRAGDGLRPPAARARPADPRVPRPRRRRPAAAVARAARRAAARGRSARAVRLKLREHDKPQSGRVQGTAGALRRAE